MPLRDGSPRAGAFASHSRRSSIPTWRTCSSAPTRRNMSPNSTAGAERVRDTVGAAADEQLEPPRPLMRELPPADPYPIDALGDVLAPAARAIHDRVQAPMAVCGNSVLATAGLAA